MIRAPRSRQHDPLRPHPRPGPARVRVGDGVNKLRQLTAQNLDGVHVKDCPPESVHREIERWPYRDIRGVLEKMAQHWRVDADVKIYASVGRYEQPIIVYEFWTENWISNFAIIESFQANHWLWSAAWRCSERGGRHVFEVDE